MHKLKEDIVASKIELRDNLKDSQMDSDKVTLKELAARVALIESWLFATALQRGDLEYGTSK